MKRMLPLIFTLILVLSACDAPDTSTTATADISDTIKIYAENISRIHIKDVSAELETDYTEKNLIKEFFSLLINQKYTGIKKLSNEAYRVELYDLDGNSILAAAFSDNTVYVDRSIEIGDTVLVKGAYESSEWSWASFSFYLEQLSKGTVVDPENIQYPANIRMPGFSEENYKLELIDKGNERVTTYEVYPMLYDFINTCFKSKNFEITDSKKLYNYDLIEAEIARTKKECQCILITFSSSDSQLEISSQNTYKESILANCLTISKDPQKPGIYKFIKDKIIFDIKVNNDFNTNFDALFEKNEKANVYVTPKEIKKLFNSKKPYYMEYICKNLGIKEWNGRAANMLEIKKMKLNSESKPYTVVSICSSFTQRMLVYKENADKTLSFIGDMEFRGWPNNPEYRLEKTGSQIWVAGTKYMGHGTGEFKSSQQWYQVTDTEVKPVLLFSFDEYSDGPYGGYSVIAKKVSIQKANGVKIIVNYDTTKKYYLYLSIAGENGALEFKGSKIVEFAWYEKQGKFVSEYASSEDGAFNILADSPEITQKCDELLKKHWNELEKIISEIPLQENEYGRNCRTESIRTFLNDCTDSTGKAELLKKLAEITSED